MGKYFILTAGVGNAGWLLVFTLIISSVIGLFYYLRIITAMMKQEEPAEKSKIPAIHPTSGFLTLLFLVFLLIGLGISPGWLMGWVSSFF